MQFKINIQAPVSKVYQAMLEKETYEQWTAIFNPSSTYEGSWEKGEKIAFIGLDEEGKKQGMQGIIRENDINRFVSIEYVGLLDGNKEVTEGPMTEGWLGAFENYTFEAQGQATALTVDLDVDDSMIDYFQKTYPKALDKLKEICEEG